MLEILDVLRLQTADGECASTVGVATTAPGEAAAHVVLPTEALRLLRWLLKLNRKESQEDMGTALGMHKATVAGHMQTLQAVGYVRVGGKGRRAAYVVTERGVAAARRDRT